MGINALKCKFVDLYSYQVSNKLKEGKLLGSVQVFLKLSIINPIYGSWLVEFYNYMTSAKGKKYIYSGWRASGVTDAVYMCKVNLPPIDPFNDHDSLPLLHRKHKNSIQLLLYQKSRMDLDAAAMMNMINQRMAIQSGIDIMLYY